MDLLSLLKALADGEFHSGSELGAELGVSRTAVWKSLDRLEELGLEYESHRGKGYRLLRQLDLLDQSVILDQIPDEFSRQLSLSCVTSCESTNSEVHNAFDSPSTRFLALTAERQTGGRGRRGKVWSSPFGQNIYLSLSFEWNKGVGELQGLSLVVGVAVADLLTQLGVKDVGLKWPNDVWIGTKKLAGILVELEGEANGVWRVTVGLGLNVYMDAKAGVHIEQPWTSLSEYKSDESVSRSELVGRLLGVLCNEIQNFESVGFAPYMKRFQGYDALSGKTVNLLGPDISGVVSGVAEDGALLLAVGDEVKAFHAGEISVRLQ